MDEQTTVLKISNPYPTGLNFFYRRFFLILAKLYSEEQCRGPEIIYLFKFFFGLDVNLITDPD
jgi:hypothetical protein